MRMLGSTLKMKAKSAVDIAMLNRKLMPATSMASSFQAKYWLAAEDKASKVSEVSSRKAITAIIAKERSRATRKAMTLEYFGGGARQIAFKSACNSPKAPLAVTR